MVDELAREQIPSTEPFDFDGEFDHYADTGCAASPSCLQCPLPQCKHDDPIWFQLYLRLARDRERCSAMTREGLTVEEAAERFGVQVRTVYRMMRRVRLEGTCSGYK